MSNSCSVGQSQKDNKAQSEIRGENHSEKETEAKL